MAARDPVSCSVTHGEESTEFIGCAKSHRTVDRMAGRMKSGNSGQAWLLTVTGSFVSGLLLAIMGALILGHVGGAAQGLSLTRSYVTEYAFAGPHWTWIIVATFGVALVLFASQRP
jgi:hypothetical protein